MPSWKGRAEGSGLSGVYRQADQSDIKRQEEPIAPGRPEQAADPPQPYKQKQQREENGEDKKEGV